MCVGGCVCTHRMRICRSCSAFWLVVCCALLAATNERGSRRKRGLAGFHESWATSTHLCIHPSICLYLQLSICVSIYTSTHLSVHPYIYLFIYLIIHLSNYLSIHPSIYTSTFLSIYLSIYLIYLSTYPSIYVYPLSVRSTCLSTYLSIYLSISGAAQYTFPNPCAFNMCW